MKDKPLQQELFQEFEKPQKKIQKSAILPRSFTFFNISYEQIVFIAIAIIMLMVLIFSLGVEYGKHLARRGEERLSAAASRTTKIAETPAPQVPKEEAKQPLPEAPTHLEAKEPAAKEPKPASPKFTIQIVAYRSKKLAQEELTALSKKGFSPSIIVGGGYYQICVGEYATKEEAAKDFERLKKIRKDCFIRKR